VQPFGHELALCLVCGGPAFKKFGSIRGHGLRRLPAEQLAHDFRRGQRVGAFRHKLKLGLGGRGALADKLRRPGRESFFDGADTNEQSGDEREDRCTTRQEQYWEEFHLRPPLGGLRALDKRRITARSGGALAAKLTDSPAS